MIYSYTSIHTSRPFNIQSTHHTRMFQCVTRGRTSHNGVGYTCIVDLGVMEYIMWGGVLDMMFGGGVVGYVYVSVVGPGVH